MVKKGDSRSADPLDHQTDPEDQLTGKAPFAHLPLERRRAERPVDEAKDHLCNRGPMETWPGEPLDVRRLRKRMGLTQRQFAGWFGFPIATLRHWERGNRQPAGTALVLLQVIHENPRVVQQAVRKARLRDPSSLAKIEPVKAHRAPPGFGRRISYWDK